MLESSCLHVQCRLPINLRNFLVEQLGLMVNTDEEALMNMAATADPATLSKIARAIRRYSTERAHEVWAECAVELATLRLHCGERGAGAALCLKCARVELDEGSENGHSAPPCLSVDLTKCLPENGEGAEVNLSQIQRMIEEFRALRVAFGLPHYELDCYQRGNQIVFTWRPLP